MASSYFSPSQRQGRRITIDFWMSTAAGLHALLVLSNFAFYRPENLFARLGILINTPVDLMKSLLVSEAGFGAMGARGAVVVPLEILKDVERLPTRLGVHRSRDIYVRSGKRAMQMCLYCSSSADCAIVDLSGVLLEYLRATTLLFLLITHVNGQQTKSTGSPQPVPYPLTRMRARGSWYVGVFVLENACVFVESASTTSTNGTSKPTMATGLIGLVATLIGASLL